MTETMAIKLNTISEAVRDIMCEANNEAIDMILKKVVERVELIEKLLNNGETFIEILHGDRLRKLIEKRHELNLKKWELYWTISQLHEMRHM